MIVDGSAGRNAGTAFVSPQTDYNMDYKTETGYILSQLNYKEEEAKRFDDIAFHLYCIPVQERIEILATLMTQFGIIPVDNRGIDYRSVMTKCLRILATRK